MQFTCPRLRRALALTGQCHCQSSPGLPDTELREQDRATVVMKRGCFPSCLVLSIFAEKKEQRARGSCCESTGCPWLASQAGCNGDVWLLDPWHLCEAWPFCTPFAKAGPLTRVMAVAPGVQEGRYHLKQGTSGGAGTHGSTVDTKHGAALASLQCCAPPTLCPLMGTGPASADPGVPHSCLQHWPGHCLQPVSPWVALSSCREGCRGSGGLSGTRITGLRR